MSNQGAYTLTDPTGAQMDISSESAEAVRFVSQSVEARAAVAELIADANRWRAVTATYAGFQDRGGKMFAYISTPQWSGDWVDFNDAIDRHFEINDAALARARGAA
jgi:hypothetical protein